MSDLIPVADAALTPSAVFAPGGVRALLDKMVAEAREQAKALDVSTAKGRAEIKSLAYKVARSKTALDEMGKGLTDEWRERTNAVNSERRIIRAELEALTEEVRQPLTDFESAEAARLAEARRAQEAEERAAQAERDREAAAIRAEEDARRREQEAIEAERRRAASAKAAEQAAAAQRAENLAHKARINREVLLGLTSNMAGAFSGTAEEADALGKVLIRAIVSGAIPHTSIAY